MMEDFSFLSFLVCSASFDDFIKNYAYIFKALHTILYILTKYKSVQVVIPVNAIYGKISEIQL